MKNVPPPYSWNLFPRQHESIYVGDVRDSLQPPWPRHSRVKAELSLVSGALSRSVPATSGCTVPRHGKDSAAASNSRPRRSPLTVPPVIAHPPVEPLSSTSASGILQPSFSSSSFHVFPPFSFQPERASVWRCSTRHLREATTAFHVHQSGQATCTTAANREALRVGPPFWLGAPRL